MYLQRISFLEKSVFYLPEDNLINDYRDRAFKQRGNFDRELVNERIKFKEVLLIGPDGESLGTVSSRDALQKSLDLGLDLYCVSPNSNPPVCRILDYGKYKFDKEKKEREAKKNQKKTVVKEIRFTATTDKHDLETKARNAIDFLKKAYKVKVSVFIKGRMMQRMDIVKQTLNTFLDLVKDYSTIEKEPELLGKDYSIMLNPKKNTNNGGQKNAKDEK